MLVRIRVQNGGETGAPPFQRTALALASLLTPAALVSFTVSIWNITSDMRWTTNFFISEGTFSHWQAWLGTSGILWLLARLLDRYAEQEEDFSG